MKLPRKSLARACPKTLLARACPCESTGVFSAENHPRSHPVGYPEALRAVALREPFSEHTARSYEGFWTSSRGFTLIEVLIVVALLATAASFSILIGIDSIGRSVAISERDLAITFLETARTNALANVDESPHGLHIDATSFVLFTGTAYNPSDGKNRVYERAAAVTVTPTGDIVFTQLSGTVDTGAGTITFSDSAQSATLEVNKEGRIEW